MSPFTLAKICHTWRELAFSTPSLWCNISVNAYEPNLLLLNHRVAHSGVMPLSIHLFWLPNPRPEGPSRQAISSVIEQLHRTSSLCLNLPIKSITRLSTVLSSPNAAPLLEDLHLHSHIFVTIPLKGAIEPPHKRRLLLEYLDCDEIRLDWMNISHLTLKRCRIAGVLSNILASKDLKHFALEYCEVPRGQTIVDCRSIEVLSLKSFHSAEFMLTKTSLRSLRNLEIDVGDAVDQLYPLIPDFLHRSLCQLQVLIIHDWGKYASEEADDRLVPALIGALKSANALQHLTLEAYENFPSSNPEPFVQHLLLERDFLPCLQTLSLRARYILPIDLMLNVLAADGDSSETTTPVRPLRKFNLELWMTLLEIGPLLRDDVLRILQLRAACKTISIRCALRWDLPELTTDVILYWKRKYGL